MTRRLLHDCTPDSDTFVVRLPSGSSRDVEDWHRALIAVDGPAWVAALMAVRNRVAQALGLNTAGGASGTSPFTLLGVVGDALVVGADDKHLNFRGVLRVVGDDLLCATVVQHNNALGRAYFTVVKPFHRRIVPSLLRRVAGAGHHRVLPEAAPVALRDCVTGHENAEPLASTGRVLALATRSGTSRWHARRTWGQGRANTSV